jgi:hypothetical protein
VAKSSGASENLDLEQTARLHRSFALPCRGRAGFSAQAMGTVPTRGGLSPGAVQKPVENGRRRRRTAALTPDSSTMPKEVADGPRHVCLYHDPKCDTGSIRPDTQ